ncbi:MAG: lectin-like protein [Victivallaceae bacterium]
MTKIIRSLTCIMLMFAAYFLHGEDAPVPKPPVLVYNGHCYRLFNERVSWNMAKKRCEEMGGNLVSVETPAENSFLYENIKHIDGVIFIGANDEEKTGVWRWAGSDKLLNFFQWDAGQPVSDESGKDYAAFSPASRKDCWGNYYGTVSINKTPGENTYGFICEWANAEAANKSLAPAPVPAPPPIMTPATTQTRPSVSARPLSEDPFMRAERRKKFMARNEQDRKRYSESELSEIESLYQTANKRIYSAEAQESLKKLTSKYPDANRTGCALVYLGQNCPDRPQAEEYLRQAIANYGNSWYGNGVQVGAYARFYLAGYYRQSGKTREAETLYQEIKDKYPDAVAHNGKPLADSIPK